MAPHDTQKKFNRQTVDFDILQLVLLIRLKHLIEPKWMLSIFAVLNSV